MTDGGARRHLRPAAPRTIQPPLLAVIDGAPTPVDRFTWERALRRLVLGRTKFVALMLATYADRCGDNAHPGVDRLAADCECDERTIRRHLTKLAGLGLIERTFEGSSAGRRRLADCYRLTMPANPRAIGLTRDPVTGDAHTL